MFIDTAIRRTLMLRNWREWVYRIALVAKEELGRVEVYVFGSVVEGDYTGGSDVDVLVVSPNAPDKVSDRSRLKAVIEEKLNLPYYHPFEIHIVKPEEAGIYLRKKRSAIKIL
ncbi:MAG: nucleotidyltransferase domain-containing protein [Thermoprotei archaeon]